MYTAIIEWDGMKPPTTFYNRLRELGLKVRGDDKNKEKTPLERRSTGDGSVIVQEGAIFCSSKSLAREVAMLAHDLGAAVVYVGSMEPELFHASTEDAKIHARIQSVLGRRGRPTGEKVDWVITCLEEMRTYEVLDKRHVVNCPKCHSVKIRARIGTQDAFIYPTGRSATLTSIVDNWQRHRFSQQQFEKPITDGATSKVPARLPSIAEDEERRIVEIMRNSPDFLSDLNLLPVETAADILDAVLGSRAHYAYEDRRDSRVRACIKLFERGINSSEVNLAEDDKAVDILDASAMIGTRDVTSLWFLARNKAKKATQEGGK
jgi:hypothetical protein